jgi:uncharacterized membrane protein YkgB
MDWSPLAKSALFERAGRAIALMGVALPLLLIGHSKFAAFEVEALKPLIGGTPWLAWMYAVWEPVGVSRSLGILEIATAFLLMASPWIPRAGVAGGALGALTFCVTVSILAALPIWETVWGGWPALNGLGQFLIKDIALLGIALVVLGESAARVGETRVNATARERVDDVKGDPRADHS